MIIIILISIWQVYSTTRIVVDNVSPKPQILMMGQEYIVKQNIENGEFDISLKETFTSKYIVAEVIKMYPQETIDLKLNCTVMSLSKNESYVDRYGYAFHKKQNIINIFPNTYSTTDILHCQIDVKSENLPHNYQFSVQNTEKYLCRNNCNGQACSQKYQICECPQNWLDFDCSTKGLSLTLNQFEGLDKIQLWFSILQQKYRNNEVNAKIYIMFENFEYGLPSSQYSNAQISFSYAGTTEYVRVDLSSLKFDDRLGRYPRIVIKAESYEGYRSYWTISAKATEYTESEEDYVLMYALIGVGAFLFAIVIIFILRYRHLRNRQQTNNDLKVSNQYFIPSAPYKEIVDKLKIQNPNIKTNESCSVCLLDYQLISYCRITPCYHIFHAACLNEWLTKYENCPLCREELNLEALKGMKKKVLVNEFDY